MRELGIETPAALLEYLPFRYDDLRFPTPAVRLGETGGEENAVGRVVAVKENDACAASRSWSCGSPTTTAERSSAKWIGRNRYVYGRFHEGMRLFVRGRIERTLTGPTVNVIAIRVRWREGESYRGELVPVYRATQGSGHAQNRERRRRKTSQRLLATAAPDPLPPALARARNYESMRRRVPVDSRAGRRPRRRQRARERFIFAEFLALATGGSCAAASASATTMRARCAFRPSSLDEFEAALPFR